MLVSPGILATSISCWQNLREFTQQIRLIEGFHLYEIQIKGLRIPE